MFYFLGHLFIWLLLFFTCRRLHLCVPSPSASLSPSSSCFPSFTILPSPLPPSPSFVSSCTLASSCGLLRMCSINLGLSLRTSRATTAAAVVLHTVAVVILHSPVLHLSCTASPRGVIPADLLWQLKRSTEQKGNPNLYLRKIPRYPFSALRNGLERCWVMEAVQMRLKVSRYIYCHQRSVSVIGDSLSPLDGNKSGNTMWRSP